MLPYTSQTRMLKPQTALTQGLYVQLTCRIPQSKQCISKKALYLLTKTGSLR